MVKDDNDNRHGAQAVERGIVAHGFLSRPVLRKEAALLRALSGPSSRLINKLKLTYTVKYATAKLSTVSGCEATAIFVKRGYELAASIRALQGAIGRKEIWRAALTPPQPQPASGAPQVDP
jgi:hypothetical protein